MSPSTKPLDAVIIGAGHRSLTYAAYAELHPEELRITGVADPSDQRRQAVASRFGLDPKMCFRTAQELASRPRFADFAINGTMDHQHVPTSLPLLAAGYHLLLEKPIAVTEDELHTLARGAAQNGRTVAVCHILRYTPFYRRIRQEISGGTIGDVISIQTAEHVSYHHMAVGYVRGKWNNTTRSRSSMLMAKCCHDLDIIAWLQSGKNPRSVSSFGSNLQFRPEKAPPGAGTRCLVDCPIESDCLYSARKHYLDHPERWAFYVWDALEHRGALTHEDRVALLSGDSPYGRCVWRSDNDVVDHQTVSVEFQDGSTAAHNMVGGTSRPCRTIHVIGTRGEIQGVQEDGELVIRSIDPRPGHEYAETRVPVSQTDAHAAGDLELVKDFLALLRDGRRSLSSTTLEDSLNGHLIGFRADRSRIEHRVIDF